MIEAQWIEDQHALSLVELCQACGLETEQVTVWVVEGMLEPAGESPDDWRFDGRSLRRARTAKRLARDLQINAAGVALALDLLDEIATLEARLRCAGA